MKSTGILQLAAVLAIKRARVPLKRDLIVLARRTRRRAAGSAPSGSPMSVGAGSKARSTRCPSWADRRRRRDATGRPSAPSSSRRRRACPSGSPRGASPATAPCPGRRRRPIASSAPSAGSSRRSGRLAFCRRSRNTSRAWPRSLPAGRARASTGSRSRWAIRPFARVSSPTATTPPRADHVRHQHAQGQREAESDSARGGADLDCRMLAGRRSRGDRGLGQAGHRRSPRRGEPDRTAKVPNLSPPDTELYKSLADALRRRAPGGVVAPEIMVGFTDNWVFRRCGLHAYGFGPFVLDEDEWRRIHGNDERISVENLTRRRALLHGDAAGHGRGLMARAPGSTIRPRDGAGPATIVALIRGLAEYEHLAHEMRQRPPGSSATASAGGRTSRPSSAGAGARPWASRSTSTPTRPSSAARALYSKTSRRPRTRPGSREGAPRALAKVAVARAAQDGMDGARLEHAVDPFLQEPGRPPSQGMGADAAHGPRAPSPELRGALTERDAAWP